MKYRKQILLMSTVIVSVVLAKIAATTSIGCNDPNSCTKLSDGSEACTLIGYTCPTNSLGPKILYLIALLAFLALAYSFWKMRITKP